MIYLDIDRNGHIDKDEFRYGVGKLLTIRNLQKRSHVSNMMEMLKVTIPLISGVIMLAALGKPLVDNVKQFAESVKIKPIYGSFIFLPLATNATTAIAAVKAANQKRHHITSFIFSEVCPFLDYDFIYKRHFLPTFLSEWVDLGCILSQSTQICC